MALSFVLGIAMPASLTYAQIGGDIHIRIGPPPPRHEVIIERPDRDAVWIPGFHEYDPGGRVYVWRPGRWDHPPRRGAIWVAPRYRRRHGEYIYSPGRWR